MLMPSWSSAPSQPGKSQQKTLTSRDPVLGEQITKEICNRLRLFELTALKGCYIRLGQRELFVQQIATIRQISYAEIL
jgi:hypothetical protein